MLLMVYGVYSQVRLDLIYHQVVYLVILYFHKVLCLETVAVHLALELLVKLFASCFLHLEKYDFDLFVYQQNYFANEEVCN